jgi:hypothetical protein
MVWGCMSAKGIGILRVVDGNMNSEQDLQAMQNNMLPSVQKLHGHYFVHQQGKAPYHKSQTTMECFERNEAFALASPKYRLKSHRESVEHNLRQTGQVTASKPSWNFVKRLL